MINFHCPKCNDWLSVPDSLIGNKETCPNCQNVCIVPNPSVVPSQPTIITIPRVEGQSKIARQIPRMPMIMKVGLALYIISFLSSFLMGNELPNIIEDMKTKIGGFACVLALCLPFEILGLIMACFGRSWGSIVMLFTAIINIFFLIQIQFVFNLPTLFYIGAIVFFLSPPAWEYYKESDEYRRR